MDTGKLEELERKFDDLSQTVSEDGESGSITIISILDFYQDLSDIISNEEIAAILDDNRDVFINAGISKSLLSTSSSLLKNFDTETIIDVVKTDLNIDEVLTNSKSDASAETVLKSAIKQTSTMDKIKIVLKLLLSNGYFRLIIALIIVLSIYSVVITSFIFKKAKKPYYATYIPIYRDIVHLKICNFSPWVLLLAFIPLIGWLALMAIAVVSRFELSRNFGHGFFFGLGLLFFPPLFRTYLAFSEDEEFFQEK